VKEKLLGEHATRGFLLSNQTSAWLKLWDRNHNHRLTLAPLERDRRVPTSLLDTLALEEQAEKGYVLLEPEPGVRVRRVSSLKLSFTVVGFGLTLFLLIHGLLQRSQEAGPPFLFLALIVFVGTLGLGLGWVSDYLLDDTGRTHTLMNWVFQHLIALLLLLVGIAVPILVLVCTENFQDAFKDVLTAPLEASGPHRLLVAGRLLQLLLIVTLSLLPVMLFFAFDRHHLGTLRDNFTEQIFRFDPMVNDKRDIEARYGRLMDEAYGPEGDGTAVRHMPRRRSPLIVASLILTLGWTLTFLSTRTPPEIEGQVDFLSFFSPQRSALIFGFLGAYFHALHATFRSYARRDLQPKTYSHITTRILLVMILAWVFEDLWTAQRLFSESSRPVLHALVFLVGIIPETGPVLILELLRSMGLKLQRALRIPGYHLLDPHEPLTYLDGIDLYDRARLEDEGVTNVEGLAHHDLVDLMLQTRIPATRLLDWVDQAILHLHTNTHWQDEGSFNLLGNLRQHGIRTATGLVEAHAQAAHRGEGKQFLEQLSGSAPQGISRLRTVLDSMAKEDWMGNLLYWHSPPQVEVIDLRPPEVSLVRQSA
jgi:hypothetical protein